MSNSVLEQQVLEYLHSHTEPQQQQVLKYLKSLVSASNSQNEGLLKLAGSIPTDDLADMEKADQSGLGVRKVG